MYLGASAGLLVCQDHDQAEETRLGLYQNLSCLNLQDQAGLCCECGNIAESVQMSREEDYILAERLTSLDDLRPEFSFCYEKVRPPVYQTLYADISPSSREGCPERLCSR